MSPESAPEFQALKDSVVRALDKFDDKLDVLTEDVKEVREAQIRLEAQNHGDTHKEIRADLEKLIIRVVELEAKASQQTGFMLAMEWVYKLGPWILLTAFVIFNYYATAPSV